MKPNSYLLISSSKRYVLFLSLFVFMFTDIQGQTDLKTELENLKQLENSLTEKVYLHLDRTIFSPGEDLWFKAYLLEGTSLTLTSTSNNLHVELIDPDGNVISKQVILIFNGTGYGDFHLGQNRVKEGIYQIRAYTHFMRNFDEALFFRKNILIAASGEMIDETKRNENTNSKIDLQFFPEGGHLVQNIRNRVAYKLVNESGKGVPASISIIDETGHEIQKSETVHNGMGQFVFIPQPNTRYFARINSQKWENRTFELPKVTSGYTIFVGNQFNELLDFNICTSPDNIHNQQISYVIQSKGRLYSTNKIRINKEAKLVRIKKEELPSGISVITVFDENNFPVCERLIYNQFTPKLNITITPENKENTNRQKVNLTIETTNEKGKHVPANLSMSVVGEYIAVKENILLSQNSSILSSILIRSDIKGKIEDPDLYFEDFDKRKHYYLDLLLLTQGWRKYIWKEAVSSDSFVMKYQYESGFLLTGEAKTLVLKHPIPNSKVSLTMTDGSFYYDEVNADENGKFTFENTYFMDTTTLVFQAYNKRDRRNTIIELNESTYTSPPVTILKHALPKSTTTDLTDIINHAKIIKEIEDSLEQKNYQFLNEITIKTQKRRTLDDHFRLYTHPDEVIEVKDKYAGYNTILEIIDEQVPSVRVYGFCPNAEVLIRGNRVLGNELTKGSGAAFILDGMFVEIEDICSVPVTQVDKIEVLKGASAAIFGNRGMQGIIAVYLNKGAKKWENTPTGIVKIKPKGYYRSREFYTPKYGTNQEQFQGPDYRNTIFWEPNIITDKDGRAKVSFYTSDDSGKFIISVEGVGIEEGLGKAQNTINVLSNLSPAGLK